MKIKKSFKIFLFFCLLIYPINLLSSNIAVINLNNIYNNNNDYIKFIEKINLDKKNEFDSLSLIKKQIDELKNKIDSDKLILDSSQIDILIQEYNNKITTYNDKTKIIENKYQKIIKKNEDVLLQEIIYFLQNIAESRNIDLILTERNYFMVSDSIDLTDEIIENFKNKNINFKYNLE